MSRKTGLRRKQITKQLWSACRCGPLSMKSMKWPRGRFAVFVCAVTFAAGSWRFSAAAESDIEQGTFPSSWTTGGPNCLEVPDWQIHEYSPSFYILRQSGCTDFE